MKVISSLLIAAIGQVAAGVIKTTNHVQPRANVDQSCDANKDAVINAMDESKTLLSIAKYHANNDQDKWLIDNFFGDFSNSNGDINPINVINDMSLYDPSYSSSGEPRQSCNDVLNYCDQGIIAYSAVDQDLINFCPNFFNYVSLNEVCKSLNPSQGYVKAGIIVHELSHIVGNTSDICYGIDCVMDLSGNDPSSAVNNADNYHFFALAAYSLNTTGSSQCNQ